ncbi:Fc.00g107450.m01.CDS01 [Cosmosporella sp. VM-42]
MSTQPIPRPILDHIVILVSPQSLADIPQRLKDTLTVIDGGEHAGGLTFNKLIIFPDGVYIELIAFREKSDPVGRKKHRWGQLEEGTIIDWAFTLPHESDFAAVQQRVRDANAGVIYADPVAGGRTRPDGTVLKWAVAAANETSGSPIWPGHAPFWCLDRTPRRLRVPYQDEQDGSILGLLPHTKHPSGAEGVSHVAISVPEKDLATLTLVYDAIHKSSPEAEATKTGWHFGVPSHSTKGNRSVTLSAIGDDCGGSKIKIRLLGNPESPNSVELLPGLVLEIKA